jgi:pSer/pThr/pTyr-binding forkhead associated (FHA) protein
MRVAVISGVDAGRDCAVGVTALRIGSGSDNDLCITDRHASRNHCEIFARDGQAWVRDVGSTNGTFLDDLRVVEARVSTSSRLRVGSTELCVRLVASDACDLAAARGGFGEMVGNSPAMLQFFQS